ncbi:Na+-translocating NADH-quinone reductase subunit C [Escherichia coli]|uniref:Na+-translocating NADH-quinone reductase subunit C n=1 Tax=Escherichia coli TaxID=562 RepID=UPI003871EFC2
MRKGKIIVASMMVLCVLIFVAAAAWFMLFQGEMTEPTEEEKQAAILHAAGLMKSETQDKKSVETLYHRYIIQRHVNLDSGELVAGSSADTARQKCEKLAPERDPAQVRQRCTVADVFFVKDKNNEIQQVIIPVTGKGAKSMMHAFLALGLDGRTVRNLYYYQQRETPFLGARVEDANWRKQWPGKRLLDNSGHPALMNPLMILVKIIKLRWIHILSYDQMVSRKINNQTTRCANSIFYTTLFTNSAPNYT